jgi:hypothetical protein
MSRPLPSQGIKTQENATYINDQSENNNDQRFQYGRGTRYAAITVICFISFQTKIVLRGYRIIPGYLSCIALGQGPDDRGFDSRQELRIFLYATASRPALGPTQPPIQWVPETLSLGVKRPWREANHSHPSSAEVKNTWSYTSSHQFAFMAWCSVKKAQVHFYLTFYIYLYLVIYSRFPLVFL